MIFFTIRSYLLRLEANRNNQFNCPSLWLDLRVTAVSVEGIFKAGNCSIIFISGLGVIPTIVYLIVNFSHDLLVNLGQITKYRVSYKYNIHGIKCSSFLAGLASIHFDIRAINAEIIQSFFAE